MRRFSGIFFVALIFILSGCQTEIDQVSYSEHVQPILDDNCLKCHSDKVSQGNISLEDYQTVMESRYKGHTTPLVIPGNANNSRLFIVVNTSNEALRMPPANLGEDRLGDDDIKIIKKWIEQGAANN